jgi:hypothetical protein
VIGRRGVNAPAPSVQAASVQSVAGLFDTVALPVGWPERPNKPWALFLLVKLFGLLLTTLAITQGAPFWFDLLSRVVNIRSSGGRPPVSTG